LIVEEVPFYYPFLAKFELDGDGDYDLIVGKMKGL